MGVVLRQYIKTSIMIILFFAFFIVVLMYCKLVLNFMCNYKYTFPYHLKPFRKTYENIFNTLFLFIIKYTKVASIYSTVEVISQLTPLILLVL